MPRLSLQINSSQEIGVNLHDCAFITLNKPNEHLETLEVMKPAERVEYLKLLAASIEQEKLIEAERKRDASFHQGMLGFRSVLLFACTHQ